ncbi:extracellular solute-binding protein, family 5 [Salipiger mucosus DSM 16094]|uniref:Extracellular solute-binding protein, family 5 n=1 Tax=Salipiger mucosus DSM 16094 TaxID=1123237 RepID=S9QL93_9RHOB|nr:extracellular solute-binding protein, family 5 [Salipiger mucosus DSM 16094]
MLAATVTAAMPHGAFAETLNVGINSDVTNLDPHRATATTDKALAGWMFNGLVRFPPGSANPADIEPDLAESWEASEDGLTWTFTLREDVPFHGAYGTVTAEDVVYSLNRAASTDTSSFAGDYAAFESIEAVDPKTVQITLSTPVAGFLGLVANYHGGNIVSKAAAEEMGESFNNNPVGTGPFMFEEAVTQQYVSLAANPDYFRGAPEIDDIRYRIIPSDSSRELAFQAGELDLIYGKREQRWVEQTAAAEDTTIDVFLPGEYRTLHLNMTHEPLDDIKVRQAVAHAINVDEIVTFVGPDVGPRGCSVVPTGYLGENCDVGTYEYDPELARSLLEEAGHPDGVSFTAIVSSNASQLPIMEVIQAQLSQVGITMEMNIVDHPTYHEQIRQDASDAVFYGAARFPVADSYLTQFYHSNAIVGTDTGITNFSHCDVADEAIEAARTATSEQEQMASWAEAQRLIHEEVCSVPLFSLMQVWARHDALDYGYELNGALNLAPPITENTTLSR